MEKISKFNKRRALNKAVGPGKNPKLINVGPTFIRDYRVDLCCDCRRSHFYDCRAYEGGIKDGHTQNQWLKKITYSIFLQCESMLTSSFLTWQPPRRFDAELCKATCHLHGFCMISFTFS